MDRNTIIGKLEFEKPYKKDIGNKILDIYSYHEGLCDMYDYLFDNNDWLTFDDFIEMFDQWVKRRDEQNPENKLTPYPSIDMCSDVSGQIITDKVIHNFDNKKELFKILRGEDNE